MVTALIDVALTLVGLTVLDWRLGLAGLAPPAGLDPGHPLVPAHLQPAVRRRANRRRGPDPSLISSLTGAATACAFRLQARHLNRIQETSDAAVRADPEPAPRRRQFARC